ELGGKKRLRVIKSRKAVIYGERGGWFTISIFQPPFSPAATVSWSKTDTWGPPCPALWRLYSRGLTSSIQAFMARAPLWWSGIRKIALRSTQTHSALDCRLTEG
ncbi:hypothetical protein F443_21507, partial [Phytophthora nicotianae P1569]